MKDSKVLLTSLLKTAQMGQTGIRSVLDLGLGADFREVLEVQLREYDAIETEAQTLACQRGWELAELDPAVRFFTDKITRARIIGKDIQPKVAELIIRDNTQGMIKQLQNIHQYTGHDGSVRILSRRLLDCQEANIRQVRAFL